MPSRLPRPCTICGRLTNGARCPAHRPPRTGGNHTRTRQQRGYGIDHDRARRQLAAQAFKTCGYCGGDIGPNDPWHAAHRQDGHPELGWMPAHPACNIRARKTRGAG